MSNILTFYNSAEADALVIAYNDQISGAGITAQKGEYQRFFVPAIPDTLTAAWVAASDDKKLRMGELSALAFASTSNDSYIDVYTDLYDKEYP